MSMFDTFDRTGGVEYPYPLRVVFRAAESAVNGLSGMRVESSEPLAGYLNIKTGISALSWGEKVTVSIFETAPWRTRLEVASAAKTIFGSATTHGKNRKNIQKIIAATATALEIHGDQWAAEMGIPPAQTQAGQAVPSVADELRKLGELRDQGLLTEEEFSSQKLRLLGG